MKKIIVLIGLLSVSLFSFADTKGLSCWIHYDLVNPEMEVDDSSYKGENSWGLSLEYYIPYSEKIKFGVGTKYQYAYKLENSSDFTVHNNPKTYSFIPVYFMSDYFLTEYAYLIFHLGIGNVYTEDSFEDEFGRLKSTGVYTGIGLGFECVEFIFSIDFLETGSNKDASVSRLSIRI